MALPRNDSGHSS